MVGFPVIYTNSCLAFSIHSNVHSFMIRILEDFPLRPCSNSFFQVYRNPNSIRSQCLFAYFGASKGCVKGIMSYLLLSLLVVLCHIVLGRLLKEICSLKSLSLSQGKVGMR